MTPPLTLKAAAGPSTGSDALGVATDPADLPWVASVNAAKGNPQLPLAAGDYFDPTVKSVPRTFNTSGFVTSPEPAPVDPKTGLVPISNIDICNWINHQQPFVGNACPRCGTLLSGQVVSLG